MIVTQWFNPRKKEFPVHVGVYQRKWESGYMTYSFWNGNGWAYASYTVEAAIRQRHDYSMEQCALWRGIAK